jgi:hypothetical protein
MVLEVHKMENTKVCVLKLSEAEDTLLNDLARQTHRTRSGMVAFLLEQEKARQIEQVNRLPSVNDWVKDPAVNSLPAPVYPQHPE